jgi:hypothetical protein
MWEKIINPISSSSDVVVVVERIREGKYFFNKIK